MQQISRQAEGESRIAHHLPMLTRLPDPHSKWQTHQSPLALAARRPVLRIDTERLQISATCTLSVLYLAGMTFELSCLY
jgi:hypothetical protein